MDKPHADARAGGSLPERRRGRSNNVISSGAGISAGAGNPPHALARRVHPLAVSRGDVIIGAAAGLLLPPPPPFLAAAGLEPSDKLGCPASEPLAHRAEWGGCRRLGGEVGR